MLDKKTLSNELVKLIPMIKEDFEWVYAAASDPGIWEQHPDKLRYSPIGFTKYFQKLIETDIPYLIIDQNTEQVIGATSFYQFDEANKSVAIGYSFLKTEYWGGLYNKSIKQLMMDFAFQEVDKVIYHVRKDNLRSKAALAKIGAIEESEYPAEDGSGIQVQFSIQKKDYQ
ncbi:GNAT family N-acetyltransferase [Sphingobacterium sp. DK4209]|uniref:GNAT family N-acetyltransferase n=1 Tax=Sphingobacterium zhuxiongii TaxID=2662364 RepID=A0A5Q0Q915_9SPHI|nr:MULTISPECIES: GNAT family N-acetyltransferase [unclassified Sphingobacterium]MVZ65074.1 GNAT family N-acetyltransferase [Sphingobacterium sp. DK4209]QGA26023.1 GNAT family N-acetyltransferase [Sphingobacterium sp. dk4302]